MKLIREYEDFKKGNEMYPDEYNKKWVEIVGKIMNSEKEIDMKTEPKKFWMITGDGNLPKFRHYDVASARQEATRLAKANPGMEFFVLEALEMIEQPVGIKRHCF